MRLNRPTVRSHLRYALPVLVLSVALLVGPAPVAGASDDATNVTAYRATNATFESAADVETAIASGTVEPADTVVLGDTLVVAIESERLAEEMAAGEGSTTERFFDALDGDATFRIHQTNPTPERPRKRALLGPENVTVYRHGTTTYALVRTGNLTFRYRGNEDGTAKIFGGERFAIEFGYGLSESFSPGPSVPVVELYPYKSAFDAGAWYDPLPPEWVRLPVAVNVAPTDSLVVRVRPADGQPIAVPVSPEEVPDYLHVWVDLRGLAPGTEYALELVHDGEVVDRYDGTVREPRARVTNATLARVGGQTVLNVTATLSHGGDVAVLNEACERAGARYDIPPGVERRVTIELWHENGTKVQAAPDEYGVLVRAEREGTARAAVYHGPTARTSVGFEGTCETPTPRPLPESVAPSTATTTTATEARSTTTAASPTATTTGGGPGFGVVAALGSLVAVASLAVRRRAKR